MPCQNVHFSSFYLDLCAIKSLEKIAFIFRLTSSYGPPLHKFNPGNIGMANGLSLAIYTDVSGCGYQLSNMNAAPAWR